MTAWKAVGWFWLVAGLGIAVYLLTGSLPAPRAGQAMASVSAPTPRGRCWLAPSRVRRLDRAGTECTYDYGCVVDNIGAVWALEEPIVVECVADGHGRRTR